RQCAQHLNDVLFPWPRSLEFRMLRPKQLEKSRNRCIGLVAYARLLANRDEMATGWLIMLKSCSSPTDRAPQQPRRHGKNRAFCLEKWSGREDLNLRPLGPEAMQEM